MVLITNPGRHIVVWHVLSIMMQNYVNNWDNACTSLQWLAATEHTVQPPRSYTEFILYKSALVLWGLHFNIKYQCHLTVEKCWVKNGNNTAALAQHNREIGHTINFKYTWIIVTVTYTTGWRIHEGREICKRPFCPNKRDDILNIGNTYYACTHLLTNSSSSVTNQSDAWTYWTTEYIRKPVYKTWRKPKRDCWYIEQ